MSVGLTGSDAACASLGLVIRLSVSEAVCASASLLFKSFHSWAAYVSMGLRLVLLVCCFCCISCIFVHFDFYCGGFCW